jgi:hypothetical protein
MRSLGLLILVSLSMAACSEEAAAPAGGGSTTDTGSIEMSRCADGSELRTQYLCDGQIDCYGGDDEMGCGGDFTCVGGTIIAESSICDGGEPDCPGGEDEATCN